MARVVGREKKGAFAGSIVWTARRQARVGRHGDDVAGCALLARSEPPCSAIGGGQVIDDRHRWLRRRQARTIPRRNVGCTRTPRRAADVADAMMRAIMSIMGMGMGGWPTSAHRRRIAPLRNKATAPSALRDRWMEAKAARCALRL